MSFGKGVKLSTGASIPQIGLGTWRATAGEVGASVEAAVRHGYVHLDLAHVYENQKEIGQSLKKIFSEGVVKREDLFITSKLWNSSHQPDQVPVALEQTLSDLGLEYLDLYLVHWPVAFAPGKGLYPPCPNVNGQVRLDLQTSLVDTWKAMIQLPKSKVRAIGVSNFTIEHLEGIITATGYIPIANQIEAHPLLPQDDLVAYCKEKNIHLTAYSPLGMNELGRPLLTENPVVKEVAKKLGATEAQVLIAWGVYRGYSVIPKSVKEERIKSNFQQIELSKEDYDKVNSIGKETIRYNIPCRFKPSWDIRLFHDQAEVTATHDVKIQ